MKIEQFALLIILLIGGKILNKDWTKLKQSAHGIPTYDSLIPYILEVLKNEEEATNKLIKKRLFDHLQVPEKVLTQKYPEYPNSEGILYNRVSFALSDLYKAGALERPRRGVYHITDLGRDLLDRYGDSLTKKDLETQPEYVEYMNELEIRNQRTDGILAVPDHDEETKIDIKKLINTMNNEVAIELLDKIRNSDPYFFERLVVDLLDKMGYSGENGHAKVTTKSNDGGIDGVINQDPLGTSTVYIQAKRYKEDNTVGRSAIQSFYGALAGINADRGVFITTSSYSKGAREFAKNQGIVLVDGIELTDLMLKYQVGVETAEQYVTYQIDNNYFESENSL